MKIVVNDIAASEGGALAVLHDFINDIRINGREHEWIFLLGDKKIKIYEANISILYYENIKSSWIKRLGFELFSGKHIINELNPDIYMSLQNTATIGVKAKQYVYLHQAIPFQKEKKFSFKNKKERKLAVYQYFFKFLFTFLYTVTKCTLIVQAEWLKEILSKSYSNKTIVVPPIIPNLKEDAKNSNINLSKNMNIFFYPAGNYIYKNHDLLFNAFSKTSDKKSRLYVTVEQRDFPHVKDERIIFLGKINREEVIEIMRQATLVFPSYIETFGLPLLEARLLNRPIIASDTRFSKEVLMNYEKKIFFDFNSVEDLRNKIEKNDFKKIYINDIKEPRVNSDKTLVKTILKE
ncbi:glycosyltransferase [Enterococcus casseliflavus]|uniref:glycosyltransferase n=1 Tax=Enterococcus casseliflavus TaxID=37734 RepID=UPI0028901B22|nr:glycosyltransferase [Enterococcus casseliflavus]MDT2971956.1 glycosyltransferase [Enterococcus casseliflavus]